MKFTPEHLETLRAAIAPLDTEAVRDRARRGDFPRADAVQDLNRYYRWTVLWAAVDRNRDTLTAVLHGADGNSGYNDAHIDTALRAVVSPL